MSDSAAKVWTAEAIEAEDHTCQCCDRPLKPGKKVWLELDQRTNTYHNFGGVPAERSQGQFPFGPACARKKIAEAKAALGRAA